MRRVKGGIEGVEKKKKKRRFQGGGSRGSKWEGRDMGKREEEGEGG